MASEQTVTVTVDREDAEFVAEFFEECDRGEHPVDSGEHWGRIVGAFRAAISLAATEEER